MTDPASDMLADRATLITTVILYHAGIYLADREAGVASIADDETFGAMVPADVQLAILMAIDFVASTADLDADDIATMARTLMDSLAESSTDNPQPTTEA